MASKRKRNEYDDLDRCINVLVVAVVIMALAWVMTKAIENDHYIKTLEVFIIENGLELPEKP